MKETESNSKAVAQQTVVTEVIYQPATQTSNKFLYLIIAGMIISSTLTIAIVKIIKCFRKKGGKTKITDIQLEDPERRIDPKSHNLFKTDGQSFQNMNGEGHVLRVPPSHHQMTQSELLKEILTHRQALLKARALNTIGQVSDPS